MLTLTINNQPIVLDSNTAIRVIAKNPVCYMDKLVNFGAVNGSLPFCDINRAILGNPGQFDKYSSVGDRKFEDAILAWKGAEIITGILVITKATTSYQFWLQSDLGAMGEQQQERFLTDMPWPENQNFQHREIDEYNDNDHHYGITKVHNRNFWEGKGRETTVDVEYQDTNGVTQFHDETRSAFGFAMFENYQAIVNEYQFNNYLPGCVVSPYLHLRYVIRESLRMNQWIIDRNDMFPSQEIYDNSFLKNIKVYNNFNIIQIVAATSSTEVITWDYEGNQMFADDAEVVTDRSWVMGQFDYKDLLPKKSFKEFLIGIQNDINYIFFFRKHNKVDIIDRNMVLEANPISLEGFQISDWILDGEQNLRLKFVPEYDKDDDKFGSDFKDLSDRWYDFGEPVENRAELKLIAEPKFGELRLLKSTNEILEYGWKVISQENMVKHEDQVDTLGWEFVSTGFQPFLFGDGDKEEVINTAFSSLQLTKTQIPLTVQRGNIHSMRSLWNNFTLRLLPGDFVNYSKSLFWEGENGLFQNRWKNFAQFWKYRIPVSANFQLPMNMVTHTLENITEPFSTDDGAFLIEELQITFGLHAIGKTEIKGYKI